MPEAIIIIARKMRAMAICSAKQILVGGGTPTKGKRSYLQVLFKSEQALLFPK